MKLQKSGASKVGPSGVHTSQLERAEPLVVYPPTPLSLPVLVLVLPLSSCSWVQWFAPSLFSTRED